MKPQAPCLGKYSMAGTQIAPEKLQTVESVDPSTEAAIQCIKAADKDTCTLTGINRIAEEFGKTQKAVHEAEDKGLDTAHQVTGTNTHTTQTNFERWLSDYQHLSPNEQLEIMLGGLGAALVLVSIFVLLALKHKKH